MPTLSLSLSLPSPFSLSLSLLAAESAPTTPVACCSLSHHLASCARLSSVARLPDPSYLRRHFLVHTSRVRWTRIGRVCRVDILTSVACLCDTSFLLPKRPITNASWRSDRSAPISNGSLPRLRLVSTTATRTVEEDTDRRRSCRAHMSRFYSIKKTHATARHTSRSPFFMFPPPRPFMNDHDDDDDEDDNAGDAGDDDDDMVNAGPRKPTGKGCSKFMHVAPRVPLSPWISNVRTKSI